MNVLERRNKTWNLLIQNAVSLTVKVSQSTVSLLMQAIDRLIAIQKYIESIRELSSEYT